MFRAIFLDRDGVLIENRSNYVRTLSEVEIFPEAIQALAQLKDYKVVIVTNQSAVGRGFITLEAAHLINEKLFAEIKANAGQIDGIYMCPHAPEQQCNCRKPHPGLLLQAAAELSLDLSQSLMIGDAWSDLLAGNAAGVRGIILVKTGRGNAQLLQPAPNNLSKYFVFNDLSEALKEIQKIDSSNTEKSD